MFVCFLQENKELKKQNFTFSQHGKCVAINVHYESSWIKYLSKCNINGLLIMANKGHNFFLYLFTVVI
jgi:hypothetical protein